MVGEMANGGLIGGGDYEVMCNPDDASQCVRVPKERNNNGMLGGRSEDFDFFCNPENEDECVRLPKEGRNDGMVGDMDVMELLCNPDDPTECVKMPTKDRTDGMVGDMHNDHDDHHDHDMDMHDLVDEFMGDGAFTASTAAGLATIALT